MHVSSDLVVIRYSLRIPGHSQITELPTTTTEMNAEEVCRRVAVEVDPDAEEISSPKLVYTGFETRFAWHCRVRDAEGQELSAFVTPQFVWSQYPQSS